MQRPRLKAESAATPKIGHLLTSVATIAKSPSRVWTRDAQLKLRCLALCAAALQLPHISH